jgi:ABC-type uncharacterized transport system substrate-binding protein
VDHFEAVGHLHYQASALLVRIFVLRAMGNPKWMEDVDKLGDVATGSQDEQALGWALSGKASKSELLAGLARELVSRNVDLIYASSTNAVAAAKEATSTIPIVFEGVADPLKAGCVDSLARPGRNITGVANFSIDLTPKRVQLLKQTLPSLVRLGVLAQVRQERALSLFAKTASVSASIGQVPVQADLV